MSFLRDHSEGLFLLALALIVTLPDDPPHALTEIPGWLYRWVSHGLKTFVSFRAPGDRKP